MPLNAAKGPVRRAFLVALSLAAYWVMAVSVSDRIGVTGDEVIHVTGGYSYWRFNDYRLHPENGTLPMRIAALPLLRMNLGFPSLDAEDWLNSKVDRVGYDFFFELGNPVDRMLRNGRAMIALTGAFALALTWLWARRLFGPTAGWVALALGALSPTMLAHGGLVTSDMAMTAFFLATISVYWRLLHRATWARLAAAGFLTGAAFLAKMSGVLLVPMAALLIAARLLKRAPIVLAFGRVRWLRGFAPRFAAGTLLLGVSGIVGVVVLWAGYGFRFEGFNRGASDAKGYYFSWPIVLDEQPVPLPWTEENPSALAPSQPLPRQPTTMTKLIATLRDWRVLPEAYLFGFAHTYKFSRYRPAFFMGEAGTTGWRAFFPTAFLFKTTLPVLVLFAAGLAGALAIRRIQKRQRSAPRWFYRAAPLWLFFALYWLLAVNMKLNIGHRHLLPIYPMVFVFAGASALWLRSRARRGVAIILALAITAHAADSFRARPFYLSYFQPLVGGTERAYRYFVDSSLDWGQGLPAFEEWLEEKRARGDGTPVFLSYFGADSVRWRGIDVVRVADEASDRGERVYPVQLRGGWYVVSATQFQRVYISTSGPWTPGREATYRRLLGELRDSPETRPEPARLLQVAMDVELLAFARLCHYLRDREPLELIGGSMLVFRLSDAEISEALYGPVFPPASE